MGIVAGIIAVFTLTFLFNINQGLKTPESSQCYNGKLYISNIGNTPPDKKDGDGYISLADLKGNIIKRKFISGLNAPKGITFANGKLFVADIDTVIVADAQTGEVLRRIRIPQAQFLNDTAYDGKGYVYVSDTQTNTIYRVDIRNYKVSVFLRSSELQGPNGIAFSRTGDMIIVSWGGGKVIRVENNKLETIASGFDNLDGVVILDDGSIVFSDFSAGKIYELRDGRFRKLFSRSVLTSPADIGYCNGKLFVPEFLLNDVKVFRLER
jgi:DNA-binding beta-propeller fold protein YncE